jgi:hypothetical protein
MEKHERTNALAYSAEDLILKKKVYELDNTFT